MDTMRVYNKGHVHLLLVGEATHDAAGITATLTIEASHPVGDEADIREHPGTEEVAWTADTSFGTEETITEWDAEIALRRAGSSVAELAMAARMNVDCGIEVAG